MNANLLVRKSNFLTTIKRTYVQLYTVLLFLLFTFGHPAFADDLVILKITDPAPVCSPALVDLTLPAVTAGSDADLVLSYYLDATLSTPIPDPKRVGAGVYYIVGIRVSPFKLAALPVRVIVDPASAGGTVAGGSLICTGSTSGLLTLSGQVGTVTNWQSSVAPFTTWTNIANNGTTYTSGVLTQPTQFRAAIQSGGCPAAYSIPASVTISSATVGGTISGGSNICFGGSSILTLEGHVGTVVKWQGSVSPFITWIDIANTSTTYNTGALVQTVQFRAVVQSGVCAAVNSASATVSVDPASFGGSISGGSTICSGSSGGTLTLSGNIGNVLRWQSSVSPFSTWTDIANTGITHNTGILTQTTLYRAVVQSGSCATAISTTGTVTVSASSVGGTVSGGTSICIGTSSGVLSLSGNTGVVVKWQSSVSPFTVWTDIANNLITYTSGPLSETTQFRAVVQSGNCAAANSSFTTVVVVPVTQGGTVSGGTTVCFGSTSGVLTLSGHVGSIVNWQSSVAPFNVWTNIANTSTNFTSGALTQTTQFRAIVQSGSCAAVSSASTTVTVGTAGTVTGGLSICSGTAGGTLTLSGNTGTILRWQSSVSPFSSWTDIPNTLSTYVSGILNQTTQFRAVVQNGSCPEIGSASTTVTVTELSLSFVGTSPTVSGASNGKIVANITGGTAPYTYYWKRIAPLPDTTTLENQITRLKFGEYFLTVDDNNGCSKKNNRYTLNDPPTAVDDTTSTMQNVQVTINVVANDTDSDGTIDASSVDLDPFTAGRQTSYLVDKKGIFSVELNGVVTFRPLFNFYGSVEIQYVVNDNGGLLSNRAFIRINVKSTNRPPVAVNDTVTVAEHNVASDNVILRNDSDPENQPLAIKSFAIGSTLFSPGSSWPIPNEGTIVLNLNGTFTFTPLGHFNGNVTPISYTIVDVEGLTASAILYIIVTPVVDPPIAVNDTFPDARENTRYVSQIISNDSDPKGNYPIAVSIVPVQSPQHGTLELSPDGTFVYQPIIDFVGTDTFIYQLCNSLSLCSTATVTIVIAEDDSCKVFVPNVFTPNADGIHDYFKIRCLYNYENPEIQIYNRNGNLIFKKDHYGDIDFWGSEEQAYWNGRSQNKLNVVNDELPVGTYYYTLKLGDGKVHAGFVFLAK